MINTKTRIYVANLAKYNEGKLVGKWIDLPCTDLDEQIKEILGDDEEIAIHDSESQIDNLKIGEYSDLHELNDLIEKVENLHEHELTCVEYLLWEGEELEDILEDKRYEEVRYYPNMTLAEVAEEMVNEGSFGKVPDALKYYIDFDALGRDLGYDGYVETEKGVFHSC